METNGGAMRVRVWGAVLLLTGAVGSGCGPRWAVIQQSGPPSALVGIQAYKVTGRTEGLTVGGGTEQEHLADKDAEQRVEWAADKQGMMAEFLAGLRLEGREFEFEEGPAGEGEPELIVDWVSIEPGVFSYVLNLPTHVTARLSFKVGGAVVDRIEITQSENATAFNASVGGRMRACGRRIGVVGGEFLHHANGPAE